MKTTSQVIGQVMFVVMAQRHSFLKHLPLQKSVRPAVVNPSLVPSKLKRTYVTSSWITMLILGYQSSTISPCLQPKRTFHNSSDSLFWILVFGIRHEDIFSWDLFCRVCVISMSSDISFSLRCLCTDASASTVWIVLFRFIICKCCGWVSDSLVWTSTDFSLRDWESKIGFQMLRADQKLFAYEFPLA